MNIERIVREIKSGNLVVAPTDTVYGILADSTNFDAVQKVFRCKHRVKNKALIVLVADVKMLQDYVKSLNSLEKEIIKKYFPGKLTVLLPKNSNVLDAVTCGSRYVGIRIPDNTDMISIIRSVGYPLVATSANISGQAVVTRPCELSVDVLKEVAYVEDGGVLDGEPSSIIKVVENKIKVYREGEMVNQMRRGLAESFM